MDRLTFVPAGGLANRMRAMAAAYTLSGRAGLEMQAVWFRDWALNAPFHALFRPIAEEGLTLREATLCDHLLLGRPRPRNLRIPRLFQRVMFRSALYEHQITPLCNRHFDF